MSVDHFQPGRTLLQGVGIGAVALALGAVHAGLAPVKLSLGPSDGTAPSGAASTSGAGKGPSVPAVTNGATASGAAGGAVAGSAPAAAPSGPTDGVPKAPAADGLVTLEHVLMLMQASPVQFVDARAAHEFAVSRIPGAVHVSPDMFAAGAPAAALALDRSLPIIVYCTGGQCESSLLVAIRLREMGYGQLSVYEDGMEGWTKAGQPVDTSPGPGSGPAGGGR